MVKSRKLYRVKFQEKGDSQPTTVVVETFSPSEVFGLVTLAKFVFDQGPKLVVLPDEDEVRKRFSQTQKLHLPFHVLLSVEEFLEEGADVLQVVKSDVTRIEPQSPS